MMLDAIARRLTDTSASLVYKKFEIPIVVVVFIIALFLMYGLICGVECCEECRSLRRQQYEQVPENLEV